MIFAALLFSLVVPTMQDPDPARPPFPEVPSPAYPVPKTVDEWTARRATTRATLWKLLGDLPPRPASPSVTVVRQEERDGYRVEKLSIDNGVGAKIPAWLLVPKGAGFFPGLLYCHWHAGQYNLNKEE